MLFETMVDTLLLNYITCLYNEHCLLIDQIFFILLQPLNNLPSFLSTPEAQLPPIRP
jgi:hypothetical protein